jgi:hypothetical protein
MRLFTVIVSMKKAGIILLLIGVVALMIQNTFYGYVDADGILRDSLFLPLGVLATIVGTVLLSVWGIRVLYKEVRQ